MVEQLTGDNAVAQRTASRLLAAWSTGDSAVRREELAQADKLARHASLVDSFEMERLEVLEGAVESLASTRPERVQAALQLLKHLAQPNGALLNQRSLRP